LNWSLLLPCQMKRYMKHWNDREGLSCLFLPANCWPWFSAVSCSVGLSEICCGTRDGFCIPWNVMVGGELSGWASEDKIFPLDGYPASGDWNPRSLLRTFPSPGLGFYSVTTSHRIIEAIKLYSKLCWLISNAAIGVIDDPWVFLISVKTEWKW
jgi:hypothetical protein